MEHAPFDATGKAIFRPKTGKQQQGAHRLYPKGTEYHDLLQPHNALHIVNTHSLSHHHSLLQAHFTAKQEDDNSRRRHKSQAANLDHQQDHRLAKAAPPAPGIKQNKAGNTGGRSGRKQCRKEAAGLSAAGRNRQCQQDSTQQNNAGKYQGNGLGGTEALLVATLFLGGIFPGHRLPPSAKMAQYIIIYYNRFFPLCKRVLWQEKRPPKGGLSTSK